MRRTPRPSARRFRRLLIRSVVAKGHSLQFTAEVFGVSRAYIGQVVRPERKKARELVDSAVRTGRMVRPDSCEQCDRAGRIDAHHRDYSRPLEVQWLCKECHTEADPALTNKDLIADLHRLARRLGRTPRRDDINRDGIAGTALYRMRFGSIRRAMLAAGIEYGVRLQSDEDLLDYLRELALTLGRTPTAADLRASDGPRHGIFQSRFGSLSAAQQAAGLIPNERGNVPAKPLPPGLLEEAA